MIYCPNCLTALNDSDTICPVCKTKVGDGNVPDALADTLEKNAAERLDETRLVDDYPLVDFPGSQGRAEDHPIPDNGQIPWSIAPNPTTDDTIPPRFPGQRGGIQVVQDKQAASWQSGNRQQETKEPARGSLKDDAPIIIAIVVALIIIAIAGFVFFTQEDEPDQAGENTTALETNEQAGDRKNSSTSRSNDSDDEGMSTTTTG